MAAQEERRMKTTIRLILWILLIIFMPRIVVGCTWWGNKTYSGRVIDADTLEPIEGAAVVAVWHKSWPGIGTGADTRFKMAREVLTDANGEWSIRGPRGSWGHILPLEFMYWILYIHYTNPPEFIFYKPGHRRLDRGGGMLGCFIAYPYVDQRVEGVVLEREADTEEGQRRYFREYGANTRPFIPLKDPERKLRSLCFSFTYSQNVMKIGRVWPFDQYTVVGLKKAETWEERRRARSFSISKTTPALREMFEMEDKYLWGRDKAK